MVDFASLPSRFHRCHPSNILISSSQFQAYYVIYVPVDQVNYRFCRGSVRKLRFPGKFREECRPVTVDDAGIQLLFRGNFIVISTMVCDVRNYIAIKGALSFSILRDTVWCRRGFNCKWVAYSFEHCVFQTLSSGIRETERD